MRFFWSTFFPKFRRKWLFSVKMSFWKMTFFNIFHLNAFFFSSSKVEKVVLLVAYVWTKNSFLSRFEIKVCTIYVYIYMTFQNGHLMKVEIIIESSESTFFFKKKVVDMQNSQSWQQNRLRRKNMDIFGPHAQL